MNTVFTCRACGNAKPLDNFYTEKHNKRGHGSTCKECIKQRSKQWRLDNPEQYLAYNAQWDKEHPDQVRAIKCKAAKKIYYADLEKSREYLRVQSLKFYYAHRDQRLQASKQYRQTLDKEKRRLYINQWRQTSPKAKAAIRTANHVRRSRKRSLPATFTDKDWQRALEYFGYCCAVCGRQQGLWHTLAQDHWIPMAKDGGYIPTNIVPLCHGVGGCNNSKNSHDPAEWLDAKFGKRKARQILKRIEAFFAWITEQDTSHD